VVAPELFIDRYELLAAAGEGGMGTVYRAWDRVSSQLVALKLLKHAGDHGVERFEREATVLTSLEHPHIVRCLDHGRGPNGQPFLVMEWLAGETLTRLLERRQLSTAQTIDLGLRLASGLALAHARGVVHRDIKPSNILVQYDDVTQVKLLDFGIARVQQRSTTLTKTGSVLGTVGYMAPEQARGEAHVGPEADVFALGCVLFECVTGRPAFQGRHAMAILAKLLLEELPRVAVSAPDIPAGFGELLDHMLAKAPSARPPDAGAVWQLLVDVDAGQSAGPAVARASISAFERQFVSVVAIAPSYGDLIGGYDTTRETSSSSRSLVAAVRPAVQPLGARVHVLIDGTVLISFDDVEHPKEQAQRAARCALWARDNSSSLALALVTGWGEANDGSPVGEIIDRAAELLATAPSIEQRPERGLIVVDETSRQLLQAEFELADEGYGVELCGERRLGTARAGLQARATRFVGRDRDLGSIRDLMLEALDERDPVVVLVSGEAGLGKSRLRAELTAALHEHDPSLRVLDGYGDLMTSGSAFALVARLIQAAVGAEADGDPDSRRRQLEAAVAEFVAPPERERVAEFLGEILRIHFPDSDRLQLRVARQNPQIMADQVTRAYVDFMRDVVASGACVVMLDDVHWADAPSLKLIEESLLALARDRLPCAVVAFTRPDLDERFPRLWSKLRLNRVILAPLSRRAAMEFAQLLLGEDSAAQTGIGSMIERAGGNPLFLEELIHSHANSQGESLPATVLGMIGMRIAALPSELRQFLRAASVFGESFWLEGVYALLGQAAHGSTSIDARCAALLHEEFIVLRPSTRFANLGEYGFRHSLLRESAYATLTDHDRSRAHHHAGQWLVRVGERDPSVLAQHFDLGEDPEQAIGYYAEAAEQALGASDYTAAIRLAERGLALGQPSPELHSIIADACYWSRDFAKSLHAAESALAISRPGDRHDCRALGYLLAAGLFRRGAASEPQHWLERLLATEPDSDALSTLAWGFDAAIFYRGAVEPNEALNRHVRRLETIAARAPDDVLLQAWLNHVRAIWSRLLAKPWAALRYSTAAAHQFEQAGYRRFLPHAYMFVGLDRFLLGDFASADAQLTRATELAQPDSLQALVALHFAANLALAQGQTERALQWSLRAFEAADHESFQRLAAGLIHADARIAAGELALADVMLANIESYASWYPFQRTWYQSTLARLRICQNRLDDAAHAIFEGRTLHEALGRSHFARRIALDLAEIDLLHARGQSQRARALAIEAAERLLEIAALIEDSGLRRSFLDCIPDHVRLLSLTRA
jgi:hypothetical protein